VTRAQAAAFVRGRVATPRLAPLGPTCVYRELDSKVDVTLAVQATRFEALKRRMHHLITFTVEGRNAYCGRFGVTATYVALSRGRVLTITAPCPVGRRLAAAALPHLS
jgi:hypothetical protein